MTAVSLKWVQTLSESDVPPTQIAQLSDHKSLKIIENYTSAQNNRCICQIYWLKFQVNVQASLHSLRLQLRRLQLNSDQMEPAACHY